MTDIAKSGTNSASESGTAKCKEPNTPDLGSGGASALVQKRVKIEGATYCHRSAPSIHIGASLHNVLERDEDEDNGEGEGEEDYDDTLGETPKDEYDGEEEDDEDDAQFIDTDHIPPPQALDLEPAGSTREAGVLLSEGDIVR